MDEALLATLGVSAALVPLAGGIVKQTVDRFRGPFALSSQQLVLSCYCLSFFMILILQLAALTALPTLTTNGLLATLVFICNVLITGILTGNYAGALTDGHNKAREDDPARHGSMA